MNTPLTMEELAEICTTKGRPVESPSGFFCVKVDDEDGELASVVFSVSSSDLRLFVSVRMSTRSGEFTLFDHYEIDEAVLKIYKHCKAGAKERESVALDQLRNAPSQLV